MESIIRRLGPTFGVPLVTAPGKDSHAGCEAVVGGVEAEQLRRRRPRM